MFPTRFPSPRDPFWCSQSHWTAQLALISLAPLHRRPPAQRIYQPHTAPASNNLKLAPNRASDVYPSRKLPRLSERELFFFWCLLRSRARHLSHGSFKPWDRRRSAALAADVGEILNADGNNESPCRRLVQGSSAGSLNRCARAGAAPCRRHGRALFCMGLAEITGGS